MPETANRISEILKRISRKLKNKVSQEFLTYLFFLLIAIVIWYFNALNKGYTIDLSFRVKYDNLPEDKVLVETPPDRLSLTINGQGFALLKYRLGLTLYPITLDADYATLRHNPSTPPGAYYITTQSVFDKVSAQLDSDIKLEKITPDTLKLLFSEMVQKNVPVKSLLTLQFEKQYLPKGDLKIDPAVITVAGPRVIVDTIRFIYTKEERFRKLKDTLRTEIALQPINLLKYSAKKVNVTQPVEKHTEATIIVPIEAINLPDTLKMKTFPGSVTLNCLVAISDFEKLQPYLFRVVVDYTTIAEAKDNQAKVKVNLYKSPGYVSDIRFHPKNVDFIVEK